MTAARLSRPGGPVRTCRSSGRDCRDGGAARDGVRRGMEVVANGPCNGIWRGSSEDSLGFLEALRVGIGRSRAALTRSQDEFCGCVSGALDEKHVAAGAVEQGGEDLCGGCRAVIAKDALIGDTTGDFDSGEAGDVVKNLVEAGVAGRYGDHIVGVGDLLPAGGGLCAGVRGADRGKCG